MAIIKIKNQAIDLDAAEIPNLPASKITSGTFTDARIADLAAAKLTGTIATARLGSGTASSATFLAGDSSYKEVSGGIDWQSSIVTASTLTAVSGNGYWINTTSNACTITLPANPSLGDEIVFVDYARKWGTNAITINQNSKKYQGFTSPNPVYNSNGQSVSIVYSDATQGWIPTVDDDVTLETPQTYSADFLVVAGGGGGGSGGGGSFSGGGAGAGGFRTSTQTVNPGTSITVTVGDGGSAGSGKNYGGNGSASSIGGTGLTTITSAGGGGGGGQFGSGSSNGAGRDGGSGGGACARSTTRGAGNTPSVSPAQGFNGGVTTSSGRRSAGGGGGASVAGTDALPGGSNDDCTVNGSAGGTGVSNSITGSAVYYAGGGGSGCIDNSNSNSMSGGAGGNGGGGAGGDVSSTTNVNPGGAGTANTGGGGGGGATDCGNTDSDGGTGGKGVVIISVPDAKYSGTVTGSPTVATGVSGKTILTFNGTGSYTT